MKYSASATRRSQAPHRAIQCKIDLSAPSYRKGVACEAIVADRNRALGFGKTPSRDSDVSEASMLVRLRSSTFSITRS